MRLSVLLFSVLSLTACATSGTSSFDYRQPTLGNTVANTVTVNQPFDAVWDRLVERLATGFFVINNIDKSSRLINLSFSTNTPEEYVNCGRTQRHFEFKGEKREYDYAVAADSEYKATGKWGAYNHLTAVYDVSRNTDLEGRINVYVAPLSGGQTKVSVNTKYVLTVSTSGIATGYNVFGTQQQQQRVPGSSNTVSFTTQQEQKTQIGSE